MKDDKGNPVKPGTYTIFVEAAREHGTYQLTQQEVDCKKKESSVEITGGSEISSINFQYRKVNSNN
jgi:thiamine biosynthesis lipoprotein